MIERYDAAVIGAGPAGATAAAFLARAGWSVVVIERAVFPRRKVCGEFLSATNGPVLQSLDLADAIDRIAGPPVGRVGFFAAETELAAPMPALARGPWRWGRALGREHLDALLLRRAAGLGAIVLQPWSVVGLRERSAESICRLRAVEGGEMREVAARIVIAAQGSWEGQALPMQPARARPRAGDLFGFKAHWLGCELDHDLMPLLVFPGGYGGLVRSDGGRVSLSCCVRRDMLERLRLARPKARAGDAVLAHVRETTHGVHRALCRAEIEGPVLAAGPIRPGIRPLARRRIFAIGNAAGEAHPIIAEGISMAMQSAQLLCSSLIEHGDALRSSRSDPALARVARDYGRRWRLAFAPRILASAAIAALATNLGGALRAFVALSPRMLSAGAYLSGKTARRTVVPAKAGTQAHVGKSLLS